MSERFVCLVVCITTLARGVRVLLSKEGYGWGLCPELGHADLRFESGGAGVPVAGIT